MTTFIESLVNAWLDLYNGSYGEFCLSVIILLVVAITTVVIIVKFIKLMTMLLYIAFFGEIEVHEDEETHKESYTLTFN